MGENGSNGGGVAVAAPPATIGLGHTRWATHGRVTEENAHPHGDCADEVHIVLNGIVENHAVLRKQLTAEGHVFSSETDAEIVSHLIEKHYDGDLTDAVVAAFSELRGHYAFVAMHADHPDTLVAARQECPLIVGLGEGETYVASAIPAFLAHTRIVLGLKNGEIVTVDADGARIIDSNGTTVERDVEEVLWDEEDAEKGGYPTFMLKEIHDQPDAVAETIADRLADPKRVDLSELELPEGFAQSVGRIVIVACGTSYHAGMVGRYALEQWARIPVEIDVASEFRYRDPVIGPERSRHRDHPVRRDRRHPRGYAPRARARRARARGDQRDGQPGDPRRRLGPVHPRRHRDQRRRDEDLRQPGGRALPARAVARRRPRAHVARPRRGPDRRDQGAAAQDPGDDHADVDRRVQAIARSHYEQRFFLYVGRNVGLPVCLEGALKLKEISYIPTDAYAAGEMKHGPIALLDESTPVIAVATDSPVLEKVLSNVAEVRARGADVISVATEGSQHVADASDQTIWVPRTDWMLQPILAVLPLQLLAYYIARLNGLNVDQPRNLAKTVTVE